MKQFHLLSLTVTSSDSALTFFPDFEGCFSPIIFLCLEIRPRASNSLECLSLIWGLPSLHVCHPAGGHLLYVYITT